MWDASPVRRSRWVMLERRPYLLKESTMRLPRLEQENSWIVNWIEEGCGYCLTFKRKDVISSLKSAYFKSSVINWVNYLCLTYSIFVLYLFYKYLFGKVSKLTIKLNKFNTSYNSNGQYVHWLLMLCNVLMFTFRLVF